MTFTNLPIDKIVPRECNPDKVKSIREYTKGKAELAINLIEYDKKFEKIMKYVFGNVFICNNSQIADELAFGKFRVFSVNLNGDISDPNGVLIGGHNFRKNGVTLIEKSQKLNDIKNKIFILKEELNKLCENKNKLNEDIEQMNQTKKALSEIEVKISENDKNSILREIEDTNLQIKTFDNKISIQKEKIKENNTKLEEIESRIQKENNKINELKELQNKKGGKKQENILKKQIDDKLNEINTFKNELENLKSEFNKITLKERELSFSINNQTDKVKSDKEEIENLKKEIEEMSKKVNNLKKQIIEKETEIFNANKENDKDQQIVVELISSIEHDEKIIKEDDELTKRLESEIAQNSGDVKNLESKIKKLMHENSWIEIESSTFGQKGGYYDFKNKNFEKERQNYEKMLNENHELKRRINMNVDAMSAQYDKDYEEIVKKREQLNKDKDKIQESIDIIDDQRRASLKQIFEYSTVEINNIFGQVLPGSKSKLEMVDKNNILKGINIKVAFHDQWRDGLVELSGGQQALLALSFILTLLRYKPAPIYIFDEIDAALDMEHTQNIGLMLKNEFPESQFLLISLKSGMFKNANSIYQIKFFDGTSRIEKYKEDNIN